MSPVTDFRSSLSAVTSASLYAGIFNGSSGLSSQRI
ncbi:hypothetical protein PC114_g21804 [Phytophthora cactorum]|nr:hypothetical protein PC114_g21804 [Phytophthora cactorum]